MTASHTQLEIEMKPFNLDEAKAGKPVVTRSGRPVRILCWDANGPDPIVALIEYDTTSSVVQCNESGIFYNGKETYQDLFMKSEIISGWINVCDESSVYAGIYESEEQAKFYAPSGTVAQVYIECKQ